MGSWHDDIQILNVSLIIVSAIGQNNRFGGKGYIMFLNIVASFWNAAYEAQFLENTDRCAGG